MDLEERLEYLKTRKHDLQQRPESETRGPEGEPPAWLWGF